jgi:GAF domain-containing protein
MAWSRWLADRFRSGKARAVAAREAVARREREFAALTAVAAIIGRRADLVVTAEEMLGVVRDLTGMAGGAVYRFEPATRALVLVAQSGLAPNELDRFRVRPVEVTHIGAALLAGEFRVVALDEFRAADPELRALALRLGHKTQVTLPIPVKGETWGVMVLVSPDRRTFDGEGAALLEAVAQQVGLAVERTALLSEMEAKTDRLAVIARENAQRLEETRALLEVAEILNSTLEPRRLLRQVAIKIAQVCRVDRCNIERWDGEKVVPLMSQFADGRRADDMWRSFTAEHAYRPVEVPAYVRAIETRRPVVIDDTGTAGLIPQSWIDLYSVRATMVVPLIRQDQVMGVMELDYCAGPTPFEPWQVDLAMAIGGQLALSLENSRLYVEAERRLRQTSTLFAVGQALSEPGPSAEVMRGVARAVARAFGADMVGIYALDPSREALRAVAGYHVPRHLVEIFMTRPFVLARLPALLDAWRSGRAAWSPDVKGDARFDADTLEGVDPHSVLFAPTPVRGESVGAIFLVWWQTGRDITADDIRLIEAVAGQLGLGMENADLVRQTVAKLAETETLLAVSRTLSSTLDLDAMRRQFLRHVVQALGADTAGLWMLDESGGFLDGVAGYRVPADVLDAYRRTRISIAEHPLYGEAARTRRSVVAHDVSRDPRRPSEIGDAGAQRTQIFVPIVTNDRMVGGFAAIWWSSAREFTEGELRMVEAVASQAGVALENARLFADHQGRVAELSVLHDLSRAVTGRLDAADLMEAIYQQVARVLDVRHLVILFHDEERDELEVALRITNGRRDMAEPRRHPARSTGLMSVVLAERQPLRTADYAAECRQRGVTAVVDATDLPHWLGVPMSAGGRLLGVFALRSAERPFTERDERLLASIADLAALALGSARLFEERSRAYGELAAAQDQLIRTEKLRALGEMASGVAHDFNNLLASIVGRAQLLLQELTDPKQRRWVEVMERSALDGAQTVRRLQEFTRIRRDQPSVAVDLNRVVREALEVTESRWREEPRRLGIAVEVKTSLAAPLPAVAGDPAELREALTNLILNALDAMPKGGVLALATAFGDGRVELLVTDTGVGIPEHIKQKIFDPFFTTKGPRGTGLGLSMTYGILSRHGAQVVVESAEGRGTTFRLSFPAGAMVEAPSRPAPAPDAAHSLRCLVVDDEELVGKVLGEMLSAGGHRVEVLQQGAAAVARFGQGPFDAVFTDLSMPGLSGWDVARAIRDQAADVPIFLVTGFGAEISAEELRSHGVDAVLAKPLRIQDLDGVLAGVRPRD